MFENIIKFTAKVNDRTSHWLVENGTPIEVAEKMCLQFLQQLAAIKAQQEAQKAAIENSEKEETPVEV